MASIDSRIFVSLSEIEFLALSISRSRAEYASFDFTWNCWFSSLTSSASLS